MYNRFFRLWYYTVSHKQMLIRSLGNGEVSNIDIYFCDVVYVEIPVNMKEMEVLQTTKEDIDYITEKIGFTDKTVTVLRCENCKYYVVSSVVKVLKNDLEMFELPFDIPNYVSGTKN